MGASHRPTDSQGSAVSEDVDSAATTLLGSAQSSKSHSFDEPRKYADIELDCFDQRRKRRQQFEEHNDEEEEEEDDDDDGGDQHAKEDEHLLATETAKLTGTPSAADALPDDAEPPPPPISRKEQAVSWSSLPKKSQLAILTIARLSEPLTQTGLQSYMFYQLKSFKLANGSSPSDGTVARQAGMLAAAFTGAQFCTAMLWGRLADWDGMGRKKVVLVGLLGTAIGSLGFGFSQSFGVAVFWRVIGGMLNGNIGVMRTMISEMIKEKKFQSRAFLLMPMTFNIGVIVGPLLGGLLADPVGSYPSIFGPGSSIGGKNGIQWLTKYPYALPNVITAVFLGASLLAIGLGLEGTLEALKDKPDYGIRLGRWISRTVFRRRPDQGYTALRGHDTSNQDIELKAAFTKEHNPKVRRKLPFRRIWTSNVIFTLISHGLLAMHVGTFSNLWFIFLSTPRYNPNDSRNSPRSQNESVDNFTSLRIPDDYHPHAPFTFTGGLALPPPSIGTALAILGVIGISLQLLVYPRVSFYLGTIKSLRWSLLLFPFSYLIAPYLAIIPSSQRAPGQATGFLVWSSITIVLCIQVMARTFALPASAILVNNSSPHPSVLGTLHGIAQSVSSLTRTVGPVLAGWLYGVGLSHGVVGLAWWCMAGIAVLGAIAGRLVWEGSGHEIWLDGEEKQGEP